MKKVAILICAALCWGCADRPERDNTQYVDVFIGTGGHGHTFPGTTRPYSMVQLSPDTHLLGWDASSGYHWDDDRIYAFTHTHLSGTGIGDLGDVAILPYTGGEELLQPVASFAHEGENAVPGYYSVMLDNFGILAELTSTERVGLHRYTYPRDSVRRVMLDLAHILQPNWGHKIISNSIAIVDDSTVEGTFHTQGWAHSHLISYRISFSEPAGRITVREDGEKIALSHGREFGSEGEVRLYFEFAPSEKPLLVKVALSPVDTEGAAKNMAAELPHWNFDRVAAESREIWREALNSVQVESGDDAVLANFYTGLYHTMMAPILWQDADGRYKGMDKSIRTAPEGYVNYTVFSLWDTFRALHPLKTIIEPERASLWGDVLVQGYAEGGVLPKWPLASNYTGTMVAYPAVSVLADLQAKGLAKGDPQLWSEAALRSSVYRADLAAKFAGTREADIVTKHVMYKDEYGFVPADLIPESVSWGVEMAYCDWCVALLAAAAGNDGAQDEYMEKSGYWKRYFDPETKLMRPVMSDGRFRTPFNPYYSSHMESDYTEGTAFQWSYFVPHDMAGFIEKLGGADELESALDTLFTLPSIVEGENASNDITGLIGQYAHGNEPAHHIAYLYNWTANPHKGQRILDSVMQTMYTPTPDGIIGNEDVGQMSAWYVMSAMGFYQVTPGLPVYALGRPMIDRAAFDVKGSTFEIVVHDNSPENKYIKEARLNGKLLEEPFFPHSALIPGGKLEITMTNRPATPGEVN